MKRFFIAIFVVCLSVSLCACAYESEESYSFYYLRSEETIDYGSVHGLIAPVEREIAGQNAGVNYVLRLYLEGPLSEEFVSPFPAGTYLRTTYWEDNILTIVLSEEFSTLTNIQATLAGACLCATCHELTGAEQIQIVSGDQSYIYSISDFLYVDDTMGE